MDGLRLFLVIVGILVVLAVYLWKRRRQRASTPRRSLLDEDIPIGLDEDEAPSREIAAVTVMAREGKRFSGEALREAARAIGMTYGEQGLFHYLDEGGQPLFGLANVLKPGYFEDPSLEGLSTPGVLLFTEAPGASKIMLDAAFRLAERLDGQVCDENRRPLDGETVMQWRSSQGEPYGRS